MSKKKFIQSAIFNVIALSSIAISTSTLGAEEKCYGIAKAGKNDCGSGALKCAGNAKIDKQGDAYLTLPKGLCEKIVGGSLKPITEKTS